MPDGAGRGYRRRADLGSCRLAVVSQTIGLIFLAGALLAADSIPAAVRAHQESLDAVSRPFTYYLVADPLTAQVGGYVMSSASRQELIELCLPAPVDEDLGLYWIDLRNLQWDPDDWRLVLEELDGTEVHPYGGWSIIVRLDWLILEILDTALSASRHEDGIASYYRLLYGTANVPKTENDFFEFWEVDTNTSRHIGQIEGQSEVNRQGRRWIELRDRQGGGYCWRTRDSLVLNTQTDPLERPDGSFQHDGSELILGLPKVSSRTFARGNVQVYLLADGQGDVVEEAPTQLVEDYRRFRGVASIRNNGSCVVCHVEGIRPIDTNALVDIQTKNETAVFSTKPLDLQRFHYGSLDRIIERHQQDYQLGVYAHTGFGEVDDETGEIKGATAGQELADAVQKIAREYQKPLDLDRAAAELGVDNERLRSAIRTVGEKNPLPAGIVALAGGGTAMRDLFEEQYSNLNSILRSTVK